MWRSTRKPLGAKIGAIVGGLISGAFSLLAIRQQVRMSLKIENHNKKDKAYRELVAAFGVLIQITHPLSAKIMSEYIKSNQNLLFGDELMSAIAVETPIIAVISGEQSGSTDITVATTEQSFLKSLGKRGRMGRSIQREVRIAFSLALPSRRWKEPGIRPTEYIFSS